VLSPDRHLFLSDRKTQPAGICFKFGPDLPLWRAAIKGAFGSTRLFSGSLDHRPLPTEALSSANWSGFFLVRSVAFSRFQEELASMRGYSKRVCPGLFAYAL
jgi:hypothetical protein